MKIIIDRAVYGYVWRIVSEDDCEQTSDAYALPSEAREAAKDVAKAEGILLEPPAPYVCWTRRMNDNVNNYKEAVECGNKDMLAFAKLELQDWRIEDLLSIWDMKTIFDGTQAVKAVRDILKRMTNHLSFRARVKPGAGCVSFKELADELEKFDRAALYIAVDYLVDTGQVSGCRMLEQGKTIDELFKVKQYKWLG